MTFQKISILFACLFALNTFSQFQVDADVRARFEYRHGFGNLFPDNTDPAAFVTQRTRLNVNYKLEKLTVLMSFQDVSTWGDTKQLAIGDNNNSFSMFQGWVQYAFAPTWAVKLGRQVISYDNQRIFGGLDWAMQGRFHDAALLKYKNKNFIADFGFAFSQESQRNENTDFLLQGAFTYKSMQYAYLKKTYNKGLVSFLFLNTGFQDFTDANNTIVDGVNYRQTTGTFFKFPINTINFEGNAYYQSGKATATKDLSAYNLALEAIYKPNNTVFGLGFEVLSGTDQNGSSKNKSFFPLYGTNHKFNGFMDYFYVGNHANNVGLNDLYAKAVFKTGEKSTLLTKVHYFAANNTLINNADTYLGTELDLVYSKNLLKDVSMNIGYSHMFASNSMSLIKSGRSNNNTNNWAWVQLIVKPTLFSNSK
ncbi:alginate export family protein [Polaribacter sp. Hel_I_88]|uniref:alginate export family protein n=1 Tax=Polaribacter sp. Hel_I_88 TaxID=1250006 RepID=UPI00047DE82F|nr:alginate export family protein [Polaribacter sp. Hel_I_88]